jgi:hypothetical protein
MASDNMNTRMDVISGAWRGRLRKRKAEMNTKREREFKSLAMDMIQHKLAAGYWPDQFTRDQHEITEVTIKRMAPTICQMEVKYQRNGTEYYFIKIGTST